MKLIGPGEDITPADIAEGVLLWFTVLDGDKEQKGFLRPPSTEQIDEARYVERVTAVVMRARPEMERLAQLPPSPAHQAMYALAVKEWEKRFNEQEDGTSQKERAADTLAYLQRAQAERTRADEEAETRALLARDRYLVFACLCDEQGRRLFRGEDPNASEAWEALSPRVKDAARAPAQQLLRALETLPFG